MEKEDKRLKMAIIAGASHAIRFKERNLRATEEAIIQHIIKEVNNILSQVDKDI